MTTRSMNQIFRMLPAVCACLLAIALPATGEDEPTGPQKVKHQFTGLFMPDREQDLRDLLETLPDFKVVSVDYANAEVVLEYDAAKVWPNQKADKHVELLNNQVRTASRGTFGVKPLRTTPLDKLIQIEIPVAGLDCKGCSYGAYLMVMKIEGVERATASFRDGKVTALIDPEQTNQAALEEALKKGGVDIPASETKSNL